VSCTQRTPAGLRSGMPGIGLAIDSAMQQAPAARAAGSRHAQKFTFAPPLSFSIARASSGVATS
jgi:hypothetical protein